MRSPLPPLAAPLARMPEVRRYQIVLVASLILSFGGIVIAHLADAPDDGGRGGALAVAISFAALFVSRGHGRRFIDAAEEIGTLESVLGKFKGTKARQPDLDQIKFKLKALRDGIAIDAHRQKVQNGYIAAAAVVGTLAWGFGDWLAGWL
jgi:hypothetical protein